MYRMRIELRSDLCAANGDGFASVVDTDVTTDQYGIPFIPAKRLKGCLREAAAYIGTETAELDAVFGISGGKASGALTIGDAVVDGHDALVSEIVKNHFNPQMVTELFTVTAASTAVEASGAAKENSLRFMRVVDRKQPWNTEQNLVFYADVKLNEAYEAAFSDICKALRHIGFKRNRGYGAVRCSLEKTADTASGIQIPENLHPEQAYVLEYAVRLSENMLLPGNAADETLDFIPGQSVIGMLAREYLKHRTADVHFEHLFFSDAVKFSNLYVTDETLAEYIPVPMIYGKIKGAASGAPVDMTDAEKIRDKIIKPIKKGYISGDLRVREVRTEIIYHNSVHAEGGGLYTQLSMQKGQLFRGTITADGGSIREIAQLLAGADIAFGRSKSAQYAGCTLAASDIRSVKNSRVSTEKGDVLLYVFESDTILPDVYGNTMPTIELAAELLGIAPKDILPVSALKYRTITGFVSVLRLQKAHIRAIGAGSVIAVKAEAHTETDSVRYIGERLNEGFGKIRICRQNALLADTDAVLKLEKPESDAHSDAISKMILKLEADEKMRMEAVRYVQLHKKEILKMNSAFIGRITLMTEEADSRRNLEERLDSIKAKGKKKQAQDMVINSGANKYQDWKQQKAYLLLILQLAKYTVKQEAKHG